MIPNYPYAGRHVYFRGRVGLYAILKAMGIGAGHDVATQAFTCIAVPEGIMATGAKPKFIDIEPDGLNMDPADLSRKLTPATKAIVVQHTFGIPARIDEIMRIAHAKGIPIIEDCCHSHSSRYQGRLLGSFGEAAFFSYEWGKPMVLGLGGSVRANQPELERRLDEAFAAFTTPGWKVQGKVRLQKFAFDTLLTPRRYWFVRDSFRRLSRLGLAKGNYNPLDAGTMADDFRWRMLPDLEVSYHRTYSRQTTEFAEHSKMVAGLYAQPRSGGEIRAPNIPAGSETVFARFPLLVKNKPRLLAEARKAGVEVADWYATPVHPLSPADWHLVNYTGGSCPQAEQRAQSIVSLPTYTRVSRGHIETANRLLRRFDG